jgi:hypothetical protein
MNEADGVMLVYNPDAPAQDQQLSDWFEFFVRKNGLKDEQCMIFAHRNVNARERFRPRKCVLLFTYLIKWLYTSYVCLHRCITIYYIYDIYVYDVYIC